MMLTCEQLIAFLADYLEERLDAETLVAFERHLAVCRSCVAYLASYRETILMARAATLAPALNVEDVPEELVAAVLAVARGD